MKEINNELEDIESFIDSIDILSGSTLMEDSMDSGLFTLGEDDYGNETGLLIDDVENSVIEESTISATKSTMRIKQETKKDKEKWSTYEVTDQNYTHETTTSASRNYESVILEQTQTNTTANKIKSIFEKDKKLKYKVIYIAFIAIVSSMLGIYVNSDSYEPASSEVEEIVEVVGTPPIAKTVVNGKDYYEIDKNKMKPLELEMESSGSMYTMFSVDQGDNTYILLLDEKDLERYFDHSATMLYNLRSYLHIEEDMVIKELNTQYGFDFDYNSTYFLDLEYRGDSN